MKIRSLVTLSLLLGATCSQAAYIFTSVNQTITETFTNYNGTSAPTNWTLNAVNESNPAQQAGFVGNVGSATSTTGGWRSYGTTSPTNSSDRSLGFLGNGNFGATLANAATMTASYTNNTGVALTSLSISYTGEQWFAQLSRNTQIFVSYSLDGATFTDIAALRFNAPNTNPGAGGGIVLDGNAAGNRTVFDAFNINVSASPIAEGNTFYLRFSYNGGNNGGSRQGLAIDDVSVAVVPEPTTVALLLGGGLAAVCYRWRSRRRS